MPEAAEQAAEEGVVYTAGVSSAVLGGEEAVGHVLLLDLDGSDELTARQVASSMDGISAVFRSSADSFHVWGLSVRPFKEAILDGLSWRVADADHVASSRRRGRYVLRATAKVRETEEGPVTLYKEAPQLLAVYGDLEAHDADPRPQSLPHLRRLEEVAEEQGAEVGVPSPESVETVGAEDGLGVERYMTLDDEAKADLRGS